MASHTAELNDASATARVSFLKNPELMTLTISHLRGEDSDDKEFEHWCLLNAALICSDFRDVALDALWENLYSLVPLLKLLPGLQVEDEEYVLSGHVSQTDWDRLQYYSRKVKHFSMSFSDHPVHPSTYIRIAQLQSSALFPSLRHLSYYLNNQTSSHIFLFLSPLLDTLRFYNIAGYENTIVGPFLATLSSQHRQTLSRIVLDDGLISMDIFKNSIVRFKQLRSLEFESTFASDFILLWEVIGTLPSLATLSVKVVGSDPAGVSHPTHAPQNSKTQIHRSLGPKYFEALESLCLSRGSFSLIRHLLDTIDSPCLESIKVNPDINYVRNEHELDLITSSMTIIASKWSQSLKNLEIISRSRSMDGPNPFTISKFLTHLMVLQEMRTFCLTGWRMENVDDDVRHLVMSWPKLRTLGLFLSGNQFIPLSTLKIIAENCPELRQLHIQLDTSTIPPFDTSSKSLHHHLELLTLDRFHPPFTTESMLERQILVTQHLDLIFPYLKSIKVWDASGSEIRQLFKLCQDSRRIM